MATIYALSDPRNKGMVRYIGRTACPLETRLRNHITQRGTKPHYPVFKWIDFLLSQGLKPIIWPLELCGEGISSDREQYWIKFFKPTRQLLNVSDGPGTLGMSIRHSPEVYRKISKTLTGRKMSESQKQAWIKAGGRDGLLDSIKDRQSPIKSENGLFMFESIAQGARFLGVDNSSLSLALNGGYFCCGMRWIKTSKEEVLGHKNPTGVEIKKQFQEKAVPEESIKRIIEMSKSGITQTAIAIDFSVHQATISKILKRNRI